MHFIHNYQRSHTSHSREVNKAVSVSTVSLHIRQLCTVIGYRWRHIYIFLSINGVSYPCLPDTLSIIIHVFQWRHLSMSIRDAINPCLPVGIVMGYLVLPERYIQKVLMICLLFRFEHTWLVMELGLVL